MNTITKNDVMANISAEATKVAAGKVENYSSEVTEKLLAAWKDSDKSRDAVAKLATRFGKTSRSIVAKLSREKVYVKQEYVTKQGIKPISKEQYVATIATILGVAVEKLDSLEKVNKTVLVLLESALLGSAHEFDNKQSFAVLSDSDYAIEQAEVEEQAYFEANLGAEQDVAAE